MHSKIYNISRTEFFVSSLSIFAVDSTIPRWIDIIFLPAAQNAMINIQYWMLENLCLITAAGKYGLCLTNYQYKFIVEI